MELSKKQAIKKAWGEHFNANKEFINIEGWLLHSDKIISDTLEFIKKNKDNFDYRVVGDFPNFWSFHRPKSLEGIEYNNDWIKIESEDDLPTPVLNMEYYFIILEKEIGESTMVRGWTDKTGKYFINNETYSTIYFEDTFYRVTHYQPIEKPKPPIY